MGVIQELESSARKMYWRIGRHDEDKRVIYAQYGPQPSSQDFMVGIMDSVMLARDAVEAHNRFLQENLAILDKTATLTIS